MRALINGLSRLAVLAVAAFLIADKPARAELNTPDGWVVVESSHSYADLVERVPEAAKANKIGVVAKASATLGAKAVLDKTIPGNMVIGLYHPRFAVRMLDASVAAGIEAPIRVYITENEDGTADLSYKTPSHVFAPYMDEGGDKLRELATELDQLFDKLVTEAAAN